MTERAVHFTEIEVHRVMGIGRDQGFTLSDLSEGVNLVYGPNGSGKSTTARAIQELLWPGRTGLDRPSVSGSLDDEGNIWKIEIDAGHPTSSCNGRTGTTPEWGPSENRHRYRLALHELITDENSDFAYREAVSDEIDAILEVGISNYERFGGDLIVQIHLKLIDPTSGGVIGRVRNSEYSKRRFNEIGNDLVAKSLKDIGLIIDAP